MERYEMAELLSKKANISLEEAKITLEENEWDMLDAMVALERKYRKADDTVRVEAAETEEVPQHVSTTKRDEGHMGFKAGIREFICMLRKIFRITLDNDFTVSRFDREVLSVPVLVLIVLLVFCFWIILPLLFIGLFFGCRYRFEGRELGKPGVNKAMDKLGDVAEDIKEKFAGDEEA